MKTIVYNVTSDLSIYFLPPVIINKSELLKKKHIFLQKNYLVIIKKMNGFIIKSFEASYNFDINYRRFRGYFLC